MRCACPSRMRLRRTCLWIISCSRISLDPACLLRWRSTHVFSQLYPISLCVITIISMNHHLFPIPRRSISFGSMLLVIACVFLAFSLTATNFKISKPLPILPSALLRNYKFYRRWSLNVLFPSVLLISASPVSQTNISIQLLLSRWVHRKSLSPIALPEGLAMNTIEYYPLYVPWYKAGRSR